LTQPIDGRQVTIGYFEPAGPGYFTTLKKAGNHWQIIAITRVAPKVVARDEELLFVRTAKPGAVEITPVYGSRTTISSGGSMLVCDPNDAGYSACHSAFAQSVPLLSDRRKLDRDEIARAIRETGFFKRLEAVGSEAETAARNSPAEESRPEDGRDRLEGPWLFGIALGQDSPEVVAKKLGVDLSASSCQRAAGGGAGPKKAGSAPPRKQETDSRDSVYCWTRPPLKEVESLTVLGYDAGSGPIVKEVTITHPASSWEWVKRGLVHDLGAPDQDGAMAAKWSWGHSQVEVTYSNCKDPTDVTTCAEVRLDMKHWPTFHASVDGSQRKPATTSVSPWGLALGRDTVEQGARKLVNAGFRMSGGCAALYPHARSFLVKKCLLENSSMAGLKSADVEAIQDRSTTRLYELNYTFDLSVWDDVTKQLTNQYGTPHSSSEGAAGWWVGPVGISVVRTDKFFAVSYFHGRLRQLSYNTMRESQAAEAQMRNKGL
jgi:hypothetical protein